MFGSFNLETCPSNTQADASNRMLKKSANWETLNGER
jgi:hypothetical protein